MPETPSQLLDRWNRGERAAFDELIGQFEVELRKIARAHFRRERPGHTLQPTVIVNEAYVRLLGHTQIAYTGREHFLAMASRVIRQLLIDHARRRRAGRRGAGAVHTELRDLPGASPDPIDALIIDEAIERLALLDPRQARVVELKCFGGLENGEIAKVIGVSPATVKREWATARLWLSRELRKTGDLSGAS